jgi:hypothetical protein
MDFPQDDSMNRQHETMTSGYEVCQARLLQLSLEEESLTGEDSAQRERGVPDWAVKMSC